MYVFSLQQVVGGTAFSIIWLCPFLCLGTSTAEISTKCGIFKNVIDESWIHIVVLHYCCVLHDNYLIQSLFLWQVNNRRGKPKKLNMQFCRYRIETPVLYLHYFCHLIFYIVFLQKFRSGVYNVLVATSIGEEGLDIIEVDLVICFDANVSPLRMIQRMGRTGRKHDGQVDILFLMMRYRKFLSPKVLTMFFF